MEFIPVFLSREAQTPSCYWKTVVRMRACRGSTHGACLLKVSAPDSQLRASHRLNPIWERSCRVKGRLTSDLSVFAFCFSDGRRLKRSACSCTNKLHSHVGLLPPHWPHTRAPETRGSVRGSVLHSPAPETQPCRSKPSAESSGIFHDTCSYTLRRRSRVRGSGWRLGSITSYSQRKT